MVRLKLVNDENFNNDEKIKSALTYNLFNDNPENMNSPLEGHPLSDYLTKLTDRLVKEVKNK